MQTLKTLILAGVTAVSLSVGTAMAQDGGGGFFPDWQSEQVIAKDTAAGTVSTQRAVPNTQVQSGSADVEPMTGADHTPEYIWSHHLYGAGGVGG